MTVVATEYSGVNFLRKERRPGQGSFLFFIFLIEWSDFWFYTFKKCATGLNNQLYSGKFQQKKNPMCFTVLCICVSKEGYSKRYVNKCVTDRSST